MEGVTPAELFPPKYAILMLLLVMMMMMVRLIKWLCDADDDARIPECGMCVCVCAPSSIKGKVLLNNGSNLIIPICCDTAAAPKGMGGVVSWGG